MVYVHRDCPGAGMESHNDQCQGGFGPGAREAQRRLVFTPISSVSIEMSARRGTSGHVTGPTAARSAPADPDHSQGPRRGPSRLGGAEALAGGHISQYLPPPRGCPRSSGCMDEPTESVTRRERHDPSPDFSPVVWKKAVPRGIICSGSTCYSDIRGRPYEHRV